MGTILGAGLGVGFAAMRRAWTPALLGTSLKLRIQARNGETKINVPPWYLSAASDLSYEQRGILQANAHNASQADPARQPLIGTTGAQEDALWQFGGSAGSTGDYLSIAAGTPGWSASKDHTLAILFEQQSIAATNQQIFDSETGRLTFTVGSSGQAQVGYWDAVNSFVSIAASTLGWQVLIWQLDDAASSGKMWRQTSTGLHYLGTSAYEGTALGGITTVATNYPGAAFTPMALHELLYCDTAKLSDVGNMAAYGAREATRHGIVLA